MRVNSAIKKMVALGAGLTMVGATMFGAMAAADLKDYPAPFVKAGTYDATIILGSLAKVDDVIGAIDIATALQSANVISTPIAGGSAAVTVDNGAKFATASTKLRYGGLLNDTKVTLTKTDLKLLETKTVTGTDGTSYEIRFEINSPKASNVTFNKATLDLTEPVLFYNWNGGGAYSSVIKFPTSVNLTVLANKDITLFGKTYTLGAASEQSATKLTLYESGNDITIDKGTPATVGTDKVEVVGVNANLGSTVEGVATIKVNGEQSGIAKGSTYTLGNPQVRVYIKDIFIYDANAGLGGVRAFIGSQKIVLEDGNAVTKGTSNTVVDGTAVAFTPGGTSKTSQIAITTTPNNFATQVKGTKVGGELKDPVFGTFKWFFHSFSPALDDSTREDVIFAATNQELSLKAPLTTGAFSSVILRGNDTPTTGNETYLATSSSRRLWVANSSAVPKSDYFILNDAKDKSRFLRFSGISNTSSSQKVTVEDVASGQSTEWSHNGTTGTMTYDGTQYSFTVSPSGTSDGTISFANSMSATLYTAKGMAINLPVGNGVIQNITVSEETTYNDDGNPDAYGQLNFTVTYVESLDGNDLRLTAPTYNSRDSVPTPEWSGLIVKGDGVSYPEQAVTPFGTLVETTGDSNSRTKVTLKYAGKQAEVNFFLAPADSAATTSVSGSSSDKVVKIPVGAAQQDTDASVVSTWKTSNVIVVGGPCVNSVAASLLNSGADCKAGFKDGEAMIKLFEQSNGKTALLVAGMNGIDTQRAARVLNDYKTHQASGKLTGASVVVKGTTLADISVSSS